MKLLFFITVLLSINIAYSAGDAGSAGSYLYWGANAKQLALGKAGISSVDDASSIYINPAGLAKIKYHSICALYATLYADTSYSFLSYGYPVACGAYGIAIVNLKSEGFQLKDELNRKIGELSIHNSAIMFAHAINFEPVYFGAVFKIIKEDLGRRSSGRGIDAGIIWRVNKYLGVGAVAQNIMEPKVKFYDVENVFPIVKKIGIDITIKNLTFVADIEKIQKRNTRFHYGFEYLLLPAVAIRLGKNAEEYTAGLGLAFKKDSVRTIYLDYAFAYHRVAGQSLGSSHRVSMKINMR